MNKELNFMSVLSDRRSFLFIILLGIFLTNAIIAEIIGVKIFSLEDTLGIPPMQVPVFGEFVLDFNLTAGVLIWPVVFVTTDLINEYFGKEVVKRISYLACFLILYGFLAIWFATKLSPAAFWLEINKGPEGSNFDINYSYSKIFGQGLSIIIGSVSAFLISQILDAHIFHYIKKSTRDKYLWLRSTGSTVVSQLIDSFVVLFIAFYLLQDDASRWPLKQVIAVALLNYIYKFIVAVVLTPLLYVIHAIIDKYLGKEKAEQLVEEAILDLRQIRR